MTPLPWKVNEIDRLSIYAGAKPVCRMDKYNADGANDAELLVRAVNAHAALLAALQTIACGAYDNAHDPKAAAKIAAAALATVEPEPS